MSAERDLDDAAARALSAMILDATSTAILDRGDHAARALTELTDDSGLVMDVCAAILQATSWLAGAGGLTAEAIYAASLAMQPEDDEVPTEPAEPAVVIGGEVLEPEHVVVASEALQSALDLMSQIRVMREAAATAEDYPTMTLCDLALTGDPDSIYAIREHLAGKPTEAAK